MLNSFIAHINNESGYRNSSRNITLLKTVCKLCGTTEEHRKPREMLVVLGPLVAISFICLRLSALSSTLTPTHIPYIYTGMFSNCPKERWNVIIWGNTPDINRNAYIKKITILLTSITGVNHKHLSAECFRFQPHLFTYDMMFGLQCGQIPMENRCKLFP